MIIDRMLPEMDGLTIIKTIRGAGNSTLALILSALGEVDDRVEGLRCGGDDYLVKPFAFRELQLLEYLLRHKGQVVTRTMLLEHVWDYDFVPQTNIIDVHISRLRGKLNKGCETTLIKTIRGAGYIIEDSD
jgi:two-component system OmpR family response regulator